MAMLSWMAILASVKLRKIYHLAESWHFVRDPSRTGASLMGDCCMMWILCGPQDQPLWTRFFLLLTSLGRVVRLCCSFFSVFFLFFSCCNSFARVSLWSHCRNSGKLHCRLITQFTQSLKGSWSNYFFTFSQYIKYNSGEELGSRQWQVKGEALIILSVCGNRSLEFPLLFVTYQ